MSGQNSNNPGIGRRAFLAYTATVFAALGGIAFLLSRKKTDRRITIIEESPDSKKGHLLREPEVLKQYAKGSVYTTEVAIVGAGIAGLAAGRALSKKGMENYTILEMEKNPGGNAAGSAKGNISYPLGAHYLTIPNTENTALLDFLDECGMIREQKEGKVYYQEEYIVQAPAEQCYYQGKWHKGLLPLTWLNAKERATLDRFEMLLEKYSNEPLFGIPFKPADLNPALLALDQVSFLQFLYDNEVTEKNILAYIDYCCRDDFGGGTEHISALAGIHYFCSRRAHFHNPAEVDYLSWPKGNAFLVEKLVKQNKGKIYTDALVTAIEKKEDHFEIHFLKGESIHRILAKHVLLDTPHYISERIVREKDFRMVPQQLKVYYPWLIVNLVIDNESGSYNHAFHWDNVLFGSSSLGFINSSHQLLQVGNKKIALTWYQSFKGEQHAERGKLFRMSKEELAEMALAEMETVIKDLRQHVESISVCRRGHGMICPVPGMFTYLHEHNARLTGVENLYRIHTDVSGYSVFEEAFANGEWAAHEITKQGI